MSAKVRAKGIFRALERLRELDPEMQLQAVQTFILVAGNPGISMQELQARLKLASSSVSRNVASLGRYGRSKYSGHELVDAQEDPADRRSKLVFLTARGHRMFADIVRDIEGGLRGEDAEKGE